MYAECNNPFFPLTVRKPISAFGCKPNATGEFPCSVASMWSRICSKATAAHTRERDEGDDQQATDRTQTEAGFVYVAEKTSLPSATKPSAV